jgi:hypothetical protein
MVINFHSDWTSNEVKAGTSLEFFFIDFSQLQSKPPQLSLAFYLEIDFNHHRSQQLHTPRRLRSLLSHIKDGKAYQNQQAASHN